MSFSVKNYLALRQSLDDADCDQHTAPGEKFDFRTVNKPRNFQISTHLLSTITLILFSIVAIQTVFLIRSGRHSLSKGNIVSDQMKLRN